MKDTGLASPPSKKPHHSGAPRSRTKFWLALALSLLSLNCPGAALAQADDDDDYRPPMRRGNADDPGDSDSGASKPSTKLFVPAFVTYWTHDALGYHPSIAFTIENNTGKNLVGAPIQLQAHFRVLAEGILNIYRWQTYFDTNGGQQLVNTEAHGKRPFELPMDQSEWPMIECKILCKLADGSPSQNLLVARVQPVAMTDDDARTQLNFLLGRTRLAKARMEAQKKKDQLQAAAAPKAKPKPEPPKQTPTGAGAANTTGSGNSNLSQPHPEPEKPLTAVAASMGNPLPLKGSELQALDLLVKGAATQAGLGDDFYHFEKAMGMPVETDLQDKNWIWAQYRKQPAMRLYAGSKGRTGKADTIICILKQDTLSDSQIGSAVKALAGKFKSEKINAAEHSVRYVDNSLSSSGRLEFVVINGQSFRGLSFKLNDTDGARATAVVVSRLPGALGEQLKEEARKTNILGFLLTGLGESAQRQPSTDGDRARRSGPTYGGNDDSDQ